MPIHLPRPNQRALAGKAIRMFIVGYVLWAVCTGLHPDDIGAGVVSVALFALCATAILPTRFTVRLRAIPGFALYFAYHSLRSGMHVAALVLDPRMKLNPGWIRLDSRLPEGPARALFANLIGLLPGTLSADLDEDLHEIHLLHQDEDPVRELRELEKHVARLFGLEQLRPDREEAA